MVKRTRWALVCVLLSALGCGEAPADPDPEAEGTATVNDNEVPDPVAPPPSAPDMENIEPLSPQFCAAYAELRDAERLLSFGDGDVSAEMVDGVISGLRTLSPDAPRVLSAALDASALIYEGERARIVNDEIAEVLIERRAFDDERDLLLQMNVRQDYLARACPGLDGPTELPL